MRYWSIHPPVHESVAAYLGIGDKSAAKGADSLASASAAPGQGNPSAHEVARSLGPPLSKRRHPIPIQGS